MEIDKVKYLGFKYKCNICNSNVRLMFSSGGEEKIFKDYAIIGAGYREHVICPVCKGIDRWRYLHHVLECYTDIYSTSGKILHFAPEYVIQRKILENKECTYISADLMHDRARYVVNIENIQFKNNEFDYIICNYVLQYVDDQKALSELSRILKPGGVAVISVPISGTNALTQEFVPPKQIGTSYYRRFYGKDVKERIKQYSGLKVKKITCRNNRCTRKYGMLIGDTVFLAEK